MKVVLSILCWILVAFCAYFPFSYFHSDIDKKEVKISHILVETEEKAIDLKQQIDNGTSFEELAEQHSLCDSSKQKGDIGFNLRGRLIPNIEKAAFHIQPHIVTNPINTSEGWHLVKVTDIKYFSDKENFERRYFSSPNM